ncbi:RNA polymerase sigma factor [Paenibacillus sp.]|uniref:RNA polymerase sigma factor n=1 Tax=Paenibacillus sp. TaxID=58172 RepID=UPI002D5F0338|nr:RNA polymerase sigma factor [Paenibacillus sp.]HZG56306.1 RNA polymerase sigma factor [Paenibacillus sp.]
MSARTMSAASAAAGDAVAKPALALAPMRGTVREQTPRGRSRRDGFDDRPASVAEAASADEEFRRFVSECYAAHFAGLKTYLARYTRDAEEAADLAQETFVRLLVSRSTPMPAVPWLRRVGYRLFVDRCRRRRPAGEWLPFELLAGQPDPAAPTPEEACLERETRLRYEGLLSGLGTVERYIFQRMIYGQETYRAIGEALGCPENTVKSVVRRARQRLSQRR